MLAANRNIELAPPMIPVGANDSAGMQCSPHINCVGPARFMWHKLGPELLLYGKASYRRTVRTHTL